MFNIDLHRFDSFGSRSQFCAIGSNTIWENNKNDKEQDCVHYHLKPDWILIP